MKSFKEVFSESLDKDEKKIQDILNGWRSDDMKPYINKYGYNFVKKAISSKGSRALKIFMDDYGKRND